MKEFLKIGNERPEKRYAIGQVCLYFTRQNTVDQYETIIKVKESLAEDTKLYVSYLAHFIEIILKLQGEVEESLWNELYFYANGALRIQDCVVVVLGEGELSTANTKRWSRVLYAAALAELNSSNIIIIRPAFAVQYYF